MWKWTLSIDYYTRNLEESKMECASLCWLPPKSIYKWGMRDERKFGIRDMEQGTYKINYEMTREGAALITSYLYLH